MLSRFLRTAAVCASLLTVSTGVAAAQTAPAPAPTPATNDRAGGAPAPAALATPYNPFGIKGLTISGTLRAYDFQRLNTPEYNGAKPPAATGPNRQAFNFGGDLRADYKIGDTPFTIGGAYWGAYPFGLTGGSVGCNVGGGLIVQSPAASCSKNNAGIDNTLPGFPLSTFEYYVKYNDKHANVSIGNQVLNKAWMPAADSRIKPNLYQSADLTYNINKMISVGYTRVLRFENRTESSFDYCTLLNCTVTPAGVGSAGTLPTGVSAFSAKAPLMNGSDRGALNVKVSDRASVMVENYWFHNIADLTYLEAKYGILPSNPLKPYANFQFVNEVNSGTSILGKIQNQTIGGQLGASLTKTLSVTLGTNYAPFQYATVYATSAAAASEQFFLPGGGTNQFLTTSNTTGAAQSAVKVGPNQYRVTYGGIASPYSDSYNADPLYTTMIAVGVSDRRGGGYANKVQLTYTSLDKRLTALVAEGLFNFDTTYERNRTYEFDADVTFDFNKVRPGGYKGLSFRERFADRTTPTLPFNFKYLRHQLQYTF